MGEKTDKPGEGGSGQECAELAVVYHYQYSGVLTGGDFLLGPVFALLDPTDPCDDFSLPMSDKMRKYIEIEEGYRNYVYPDDAKNKNPTATIGHLLTDEEIKKYPMGSKVPDDVLKKWWEEDTKDAWAAASKQLCALMHSSSPPDDSEKEELLKVLVGLCFQLGIHWKGKFKKAWKALMSHDYKQAAIEILSGADHSHLSLLGEQAPGRAIRIVDILLKLGGVANGIGDFLSEEETAGIRSRNVKPTDKPPGFDKKGQERLAKKLQTQLRLHLDPQPSKKNDSGSGEDGKKEKKIFTKPDLEEEGGFKKRKGTNTNDDDPKKSGGTGQSLNSGTGTSGGWGKYGSTGASLGDNETDGGTGAAGGLWGSGTSTGTGGTGTGGSGTGDGCQNNPDPPEGEIAFSGANRGPYINLLADADSSSVMKSNVRVSAAKEGQDSTLLAKIKKLPAGLRKEVIIEYVDSKEDPNGR